MKQIQWPLHQQWPTAIGTESILALHQYCSHLHHQLSLNHQPYHDWQGCLYATSTPQMACPHHTWQLQQRSQLTIVKILSTLLPCQIHMFTQPITYQYEPNILSEWVNHFLVDSGPSLDILSCMPPSHHSPVKCPAAIDLGHSLRHSMLTAQTQHHASTMDSTHFFWHRQIGYSCSSQSTYLANISPPASYQTSYLLTAIGFEFLELTNAIAKSACTTIYSPFQIRWQSN